MYFVHQLLKVRTHSLVKPVDEFEFSNRNFLLSLTLEKVSFFSLFEVDVGIIVQSVPLLCQYLRNRGLDSSWCDVCLFCLSVHFCVILSLLFCVVWSSVSRNTR